MTAFWHKHKNAKNHPLVVTVGDGLGITYKSHGWKRGHPMLDGICFKCGSDEKTCSCEIPDIQNPITFKNKC